ncbi:hypothetical protein [Chloroflexus sp. Y-396-1]|uniref:hypothetical protein n=1 Tax=Chloroflexus sp. Y-396-1 TaxID=867845 RepID=UPI0004ADA814|nr:hypothetical protein [Chloroflexus sp. Y-396-1]
MLRLQATASPDTHLLEELRESGLSDIEVQEAVAVVGVFAFINTWTDLLNIPVDKV